MIAPKHAESPALAPSRARRTVGWILAGALLALRLPYFAGVTLVQHQSPMWLVNSFEMSTYAITALLIYWERDRLALFHIDRLALGLYLFAPFLMPFAAPSPPGQSLWATLTETCVYPVQVISAVLLGLALLPSFRKLPPVRRETWKWFGIAVVAGAILSAVFGPIMWGSAQRHAGVISLWNLLANFAMQLVVAASLEEPLFRGFLWGYLCELRWNETWIWLLQAALFTLSHIYYWGHMWVGLLVVVPLSALFFGWIVRRSRSIGATMVAHAITNSMPSFFAQLFF